jgi:hypothetical protein
LKLGMDWLSLKNMFQVTKNGSVLNGNKMELAKVALPLVFMLMNCIKFSTTR